MTQPINGVTEDPVVLFDGGTDADACVAPPAAELPMLTKVLFPADAAKEAAAAEAGRRAAEGAVILNNCGVFCY